MAIYSLAALAAVAFAQVPASSAPPNLPPPPDPMGPIKFERLDRLLTNHNVSEYLSYFTDSVTVYRENKLVASGKGQLEALAKEWVKDGWTFSLVEQFGEGIVTLVIEDVSNVPAAGSGSEKPGFKSLRAVRYTSGFDKKIFQVDILNLPGAKRPVAESGVSTFPYRPPRGPR